LGTGYRANTGSANNLRLSLQSLIVIGRGRYYESFITCVIELCSRNCRLYSALFSRNAWSCWPPHDRTLRSYSMS